LPSGIKVGTLREKYCESPYQLVSLARSLVQLISLESVSHNNDQWLTLALLNWTT